jgi:hypothetical protein
MRTRWLQTLIAFGLASILASAAATASAQISKGSDGDPFDASNGTVVLADLTNPDTDPLDAFRTGGTFEGGNTLMVNGGPGTLSYIEIQTGGLVQLEGVRVLASNDQYADPPGEPCCLRRAMSGFRLRADIDEDGSYETTVFDVLVNPQYELDPKNATDQVGVLDMTLLLEGVVIARRWRVETIQGSNSPPFEGVRIIEIDAIGALDRDLDGIRDDGDNCPDTYNPLQEDLDGDEYGNVCDNCPRIANDQSDLDEDGYGDACDALPASGNEELVLGDPTPQPPGGPVQLDATFVNPTGVEILVVRPTCFNTTFEVRDDLGQLLPPRYRIGPPVKLTLASEDPDGDLIVIGPGESFTVTCDLAELYAPEALTSGPGGTLETYEATATYSNDLIDRDCTGPSPDPVECVEVSSGTPTFVGEVTSAPVEVQIEGEPVTSEETVEASCTATPSTWYSQWRATPGPTVSTTLSGLIAGDVDPTSLRLNGSLAPVSSAPAGGDLIAVFDRAEAVAALGSVVPGTTVFPRITGAFAAGAGPAFLRAPCEVAIQAAIPVEIDIRPGSEENKINLGSNGNIPVAILGSAEFDAATVDPVTLRLASAGLKLKGQGKGGGIFSLDDVNGDGFPDLLAHIATQGLELTATSVSAELIGTTFDGTPIFGVDAVVVKE